jgi:two-component system response regulator AtoC
VTIDLPPLRHRATDVPILIDYFLDLHSRAFSVKPKPLSCEVKCMMQRYNWPGNIRQLENMIRSYVLIADEEALAADLMSVGTAAVVPEIDLVSPISLKQIIKAATKDLEKEIILKVLQSNGWSRQKTAKWLNISYRSLLYKLQDSQISAFSRRPSKAETLENVSEQS